MKAVEIDTNKLLLEVLLRLDEQLHRPLRVGQDERLPGERPVRVVVLVGVAARRLAAARALDGHASVGLGVRLFIVTEPPGPERDRFTIVHDGLSGIAGHIINLG